MHLTINRQMLKAIIPSDWSSVIFKYDYVSILWNSLSSPRGSFVSMHYSDLCKNVYPDFSMRKLYYYRVTGLAGLSVESGVTGFSLVAHYGVIRISFWMCMP